MMYNIINHKNKNPRNNEIDTLQKITAEASFEEVTADEKTELLNQSMLLNENCIKEDNGKELRYEISSD